LDSVAINLAHHATLAGDPGGELTQRLERRIGDRLALPQAVLHSVLYALKRGQVLGGHAMQVRMSVEPADAVAVSRSVNLLNMSFLSGENPSGESSLGSACPVRWTQARYRRPSVVGEFKVVSWCKDDWGGVVAWIDE
jgi:hypothetical protein